MLVLPSEDTNDCGLSVHGATTQKSFGPVLMLCPPETPPPDETLVDALVDAAVDTVACAGSLELELEDESPTCVVPVSTDPPAPPSPMLPVLPDPLTISTVFAHPGAPSAAMRTADRRRIWSEDSACTIERGFIPTQIARLLPRHEVG